MTDGQSGMPMTRTSKGRDVRKEEFVATAKKLFNSKGYESTSVDDIVDAMGVAKGLFYYYFESKDALLDLMTDGLQEEIRKVVGEIVSRTDLSAMQKVELLLSASSDIKIRSAALVNYFHQPRNRLLHFEIEQRSREFLLPALANIIEQGVREGVFRAEHPRETALAYLGAASAVGHEDISNLTNEEILRRVWIFQSITEKLFGSKPGSFSVYERLARRYIGQLPKKKYRKPKRSRQ